MPTPTPSSSTRSPSIDGVKGVLTIGMIYAHTVALLGTPGADLFSGLVGLVDLVAFSGFLFCFGFGCYHAYFRSGGPLPTRRIIPTTLKPLVAFYISGAAYHLLVERGALDGPSLLALLTLGRIAPFSEFLLAFSIMLAGVALARPLVAQLLERPPLLAALTALCLATTLLPVGSTSQYAGLVVGVQGQTLFPVVPYLPVFLLGMAGAKGGIAYDRRALLGCIVALAALLAEATLVGELRRFPPSALWVAGSFALAYCLVLAANARWRGGLVGALLASIGRSVLFYLLLSNLLLFALHAATPAPFSNLACVLIAAVLLGVIAFCATLRGSPQRGSPQRRKDAEG